MKKEYLTIIALLILIAGLLGALLFSETNETGESETAAAEEVSAVEATTETEVPIVVEAPAEIEAPAVLEASADPFYSEILTASGKKPGVPLGNGKGVFVAKDALVTLHGESGTIYASRHEEIDGQAVVSSVVLDEGFGNTTPSALSGVGDSVLAMWMATSGPSVSFSDDGGKTWGETALLAERPVGGATPTSCAWIDSDNQLRAMIGWTAPPISGDGGNLYIREFVNGIWEETVRVGSNELASSPSLACNSQGQMMVIRNGEIGNLNVYLTIRDEDGNWPDPKKAFKGADPHMAWCGNRIWIGYHGIGAFRAYSDDGGNSWEKETLSNTGKFGAIACDEKTVAITWGDFEDLGAANGKDESKRGVGAAVSFDDGETWENWRPAGEEVNQSIASISIVDETIAIFWRTLDRIRVTTY